jgi:hypothetical protein
MTKKMYCSVKQHAEKKDTSTGIHGWRASLEEAVGGFFNSASLIFHALILSKMSDC